MLIYSVQPSIKGKTKQHLLGSGWQPVEADRRQFVQTNFIEGLAITAAHYETDRRHDEGWLKANLLIVDIDEYPADDTEWTLERVWSDPFVQEYCFAAFPSSSYDTSQPKLHLYFQADALIEDKEQYRAVSEYLRGMIAVPSDPALSKPSQAVFGTEFTKISAEKSFDSPLLYFNPDAPCIETEGIEIDYAAMWDGADIIPKWSNVRSKSTSARALEHVGQPAHLQERVTLEALDFALKGWGRRTHEDWKALVMSAYAGSSSHAVVRKIMQSDEIVWKQGEREALPAWWNKHNPREKDGYTVATLFMMARRNGWLTSTTADITEAEEFYAEEVGDFLIEKMPERALIISNTGTGKTQGAIKMLKALGIPKSVFFAPTIKLCMNLSTTLTQLGVPNTLYIEEGRTKDADTLRNAHVLVTTLQTFGTKLINNGINVSEYELVVMDESDELFSSFVLSGTQVALRISSHVSPEQARAGITALSRLFADCKHVLMLDGTATNLSVNLAEAFSTVPLKVYRNQFKRKKAPVILYDTLEEARARFLNSVKSGRKTVLVADTKSECHLMELTAIEEGYVQPEEIVCITSQSGQEAKVIDFFKDVELGAAKYRVVIYNSSMGVGVSIVNTKPEVIVQIGNYITPRSNLQMLNRYRNQGEVYVYTPSSENLYDETLEQAQDRLGEATAYEHILFGLKDANSTPLARTVANLALLAATDGKEQLRARAMYYRHLLEGDGRVIMDGEGEALSKGELDAAREALASFREEIRAGWRAVAPIDRENPPETGATPIEIAKGLLHAQIARTVPAYETVDMDDTELGELVLSFGRYIRSLENLHDPNEVLEQARLDLADNTPTTGRKFHLSRMDLLGLVGLLFDDTSTVLTDEEIELRAPQFIVEVARRKATFDTLVGYRNGFDKLQAKHDEHGKLALAIVKQILKGVGLKLGKKNGPRIDGTEERQRIVSFSNMDQALTMLKLRGTETDAINFNTAKLGELFTYTKQLGPQLSKLSAEARRNSLDSGEFIL